MGGVETASCVHVVSHAAFEAQAAGGGGWHFGGWLGEANCWCVCSVVEVSILDLSRVMERPIWSEVMM